MYNKWKEEDIKFLKENYKNFTNKELAQILNRTKTAISIKLSKLGLKKTKYYYNEDYFETIDTEEKAYWLGFLYADGYISKTTYGSELGIELQKNDYNHLQKFNKSIKGNIEVKYRKRICNLNNKEYETCFIRLYSKKIVNDLMNNGVIKNKSLSIELPKLNNNLMNHFIRGYFDGDGCITKNNHKNGKEYVKCDFTCGSELFVNQLRQYLNNDNIKSYISKEDNKPFRLVIGGMKNCDKFLNYIYEDCNIYLDRKYKKKLLLYKDLNIEERIASLR